MLRQTGLALLMLCSAAVSGCETTKRTAEALRPDKTNPERFICEPAGTRPAVPPEYKIDWDRVSASPTVQVAVAQAMAEVAKLVASVRTREGVVAGYILNLEGKHFVCWNNMGWQRDYYRGLDEAPAGGMAARPRSERLAGMVGPAAHPEAFSALISFRS